MKTIVFKLLNIETALYSTQSLADKEEQEEKEQAMEWRGGQQREEQQE
jgi:hypothetical protein